MKRAIKITMLMTIKEFKRKTLDTIIKIINFCKGEFHIFLFFIILLLLFVFAISYPHIATLINKKSETEWQCGWQYWQKQEYNKAYSHWTNARRLTFFNKNQNPKHLYWSSEALKRLGKTSESEYYTKRLIKKFPNTYYSLLVEEQPLSTLDKEYLKNRYPKKWETLVKNVSSKSDVSPYLIWAIMRQESKFRKNAISKSGAVGLMQLMPTTASYKAKKLNIKEYDLYTPKDNIFLGSIYIGDLLRDFNSNIILSLASYNAGRSPVKSWGNLNATNWTEWIEMIPYKQTRIFVCNTLANYIMYQRIYGNENNFKTIKEYINILPSLK
ncbi:MAG: lytic transglycosylase domain-containing protein [Synergistaceae bacterium]